MSLLRFFILFLFSISAYSEVSEDRLLKIIENFQNKMSVHALTAYEGRFKKFYVKYDWEKQFSLKSIGGGFFTNPVKWELGVYIEGWLVRSNFDEDGVEAVLCHELGHHFFGGGGEQEADHYVMDFCLRELWGDAFSFARAIKVILQIHEFRTWVYRQYQFPEIRIQRLIECRTDSFFQGLLQEEYKFCDEHDY